MLLAETREIGRCGRFLDHPKPSWRPQAMDGWAVNGAKLMYWEGLFPKAKIRGVGRHPGSGEPMMPKSPLAENY